MVDGILSSYRCMIADYITQFFMNLYFKQQVVWPFLEVLVFPRISDDNADWLDRLFEEAEIFDVIQNFNGDKLPGPDGFLMAFFQLCWSILKLILWLYFIIFLLKVSLRKVWMQCSSLSSLKKIQQLKSRIFAPLVLLGGFIKSLLRS